MKTSIVKATFSDSVSRFLSLIIRPAIGRGPFFGFAGRGLNPTAADDQSPQNKNELGTTYGAELVLFSTALDPVPDALEPGEFRRRMRPHCARLTLFYKVEQWSRDGQRVLDLLFAGSSLEGSAHL